MHIRIENYTDIPIDELNSFLDKNLYASIFQYPIFFRALSETEGYKPCLIISRNSNGVINGSLLFYEEKLLGFYGFYISRNVVIGGPVSDDISLIDELISSYPNYVSQNTIFTEIRNHRQIDKNQLTNSNFLFKDHLNYYIDLNRSIDEIWQSFKGEVRTNVRKSNKNNVQLGVINCKDELIESYKLLEKNYKKLRIPLPKLELFLNLFNILGHKHLKIIVAKYNSKIVGTAIRLHSNNMMTAWYTAIDYEYKKLKIQDAMNWYSIQLAKKNNLMMFDFGGAGKPDQEYGPRKYKAKFNGDLKNNGRIYYYHHPLLMKVIENGYKFKKKII